MIRAAVLTVSDTCFRGEKKDISGPAVVEMLSANGFQVGGNWVVPDEQNLIEEALIAASDSSELVVTTGGTGLSPRDVTPEATRSVCDRMVDGIAEIMRADGLKQTPYAALSRAICGTRGKSLILNLPGSPRGAVSSLNAVLPVLGHALALMADVPVRHDAADSPKLRDKEFERP
jgi:molybdenum cofactor synthesis domain-containing protein